MEIKTNGGVIFKNDKKTQDNQPDYKGKINANGEEYEIALWVKEGAKGKFFGVKISEPFKKDAEPEAEAATDDLPF